MEFISVCQIILTINNYYYCKQYLKVCLCNTDAMCFLYSKNIVTHSRFEWLIIMGSGFCDWVCWHFFTIAINYNSSQPMAVYDSLHSLLDHERLLFLCDERRITADTLNCLERRLSDESLWRISRDWNILYWTKLNADGISVAMSYSSSVIPRFLLCH
jgi:hypothetical protein